MHKRIELKGKTFGRLTIIKKIGADKHRDSIWQCICSCGAIKAISGRHLKSGTTSSCGCLQKEKSTKHGMYKLPIYRIWNNMIQRCANPKALNYERYGGRGITVCKRWLTISNFLKDMGECPKGLTLERISNDKGYYKENCKWATHAEQQKNKRLHKNNTTGMNGVQPWHIGINKYKVRIMANCKEIFVGYFKTLSEAKDARKQAETKYW